MPATRRCSANRPGSATKTDAARRPMRCRASSICRRRIFDLDLAANRGRDRGREPDWSSSTRPHNPTGRIYGPRGTRAARRNARNAPSARIGPACLPAFGRGPTGGPALRRARLHQPGRALIPWTLITYSYGKVLLRHPDSGLGYLAILAADAGRGPGGAARCHILRPDGARLVFPKRPVMQYAAAGSRGSRHRPGGNLRGPARTADPRR